MKTTIFLPFAVCFFAGAGCATVDKSNAVRPDFPGIKMKVHQKHTNDTTYKSEQDTEWKITLVSYNSLPTNTVTWYRHDEAKFMIIVPSKGGVLTWSASTGSQTVGPPQYPSSDFQAFQSERRGNDDIIMLQFTCTDPTLKHGINYKLITIPDRPVFTTMAQPVAAPPQDDIVDATLCWDDSAIGI